jgi:formylglycine-generating enzyme required for sulfatase activity
MAGTTLPRPRPRSRSRFSQAAGLCLLPLLACSTAPQPGDDGGMVRIEDPVVGAYEIDRYEHPNTIGQIPTAYVGLGQAIEHCEAAGKRVCTAAEWRRACTGPAPGLRYGYGEHYEHGRCNTNAPEPTGITSRTDPAPYLTPAGANPACVSPEGVADLLGNAEEWVLDTWSGMDGVVEGGAWYTMEHYADCSGRYSRQPDFRLDPKQPVFSAGFRCCRSDQPPQVGLDRSLRIEAGQALSSSEPYDPSNEVLVGGEVHIDRYEYPNRPGVNPLVSVDWSDAELLCDQAGKRLCTVREWERACGGDAKLPYPYGQRYEAQQCDVMHGAPSPTGSFQACVSPGGAVDMVGGAWEWTASPLNLPERRSSVRQSLYEVRGGAWYVDELKSRCRPAEGYPAAPESGRYPELGFRCCRGDSATLLPPGVTDTPAPSPTCPFPLASQPGFCIDSFEHPGVPGQLPTAGLDFDGAKAACVERGMHLCSTSEWELACSGLEGRRWPYGDSYDPTTCNFGVAGRDDRNDGVALPSGSKPDCMTPEGVWDMSGNLWEWTVAPGGQGWIRGGGWNMNSGLGQCNFYTEGARDHSAPILGFRCCATPGEAHTLLEGAELIR